MLATVAAADSVKVQKKKYSVFIYSEAEPHAMYATYKQTRTLCVLQYLIVDILNCLVGLSGIPPEPHNPPFSSSDIVFL